MRIVTFTSRLPLTLSADYCAVFLPPTQHVLLEQMGGVWAIGKLDGGLALGGAGVCKAFVGNVRKFLASPAILSNYAQVVLEQIQELDSTPSGLGEGVVIPRTSALQIRNTYFSDGAGGKVFVPLFIANSTGYIYTEETPTTFLGETWNRTVVKARSSPLVLPFETNKKYFGAGMVSGNYPIVLAGKSGMAMEANKWAVAESSPVGGIIRSSAPANTTWELANFKMWDDGEAPAFAKVISDAYSNKIYRFVLPASPQPELKFSYKISAEQKIRAFRYRSTATIPTTVEDGGVTPLNLPATSGGGWEWRGYTPLSSTVTFLFGANGYIDIDIASLESDYFPNHQRVLNLFSSLPAFAGISPDFSFLPTKEGYEIYLNGNLAALQATISRSQFLIKNLQREGVEVRLLLSPQCIPTQFIKQAMQEIAGGLNPIDVFQIDNTVFVTLLCATDNNEALLLSHLYALRDTIQNIFRNIIPQWESAGVEIKVVAIHRIAK